MVIGRFSAPTSPEVKPGRRLLINCARPRALDISAGVGAAYTTRLLVDAGWDVIRAELPGGRGLHTVEAKGYGYRNALVGGVTVYGWCVPAILKALGDEWLDRGWVEVFFRRPVYPDDRMTVRVAAGAENTHTLTAEKEESGETCIRGRVGVGEATWLEQLQLSNRRKADPPLEQRPALTLETAPIGRDLRTLGIEMTGEAARDYATTHQGETNHLFLGKAPLVHPALVARQMMPLLAHSYEYGRPSIHVSSHIQHLAPVRAGQRLTLTGHFIDAYEHKGHHYAVFDGDLLGEEGRELVRMRHTNIFRVARRGER